MLQQFLVYCRAEVIVKVEPPSRYESDDWDLFEKSLKRYYFDNGPQQREYRFRFLGLSQNSPNAKKVSLT